MPVLRSLALAMEMPPSRMYRTAPPPVPLGRQGAGALPTLDAVWLPAPVGGDRRCAAAGS